MRPIYSFLSSNSLEGWQHCKQYFAAPCVIQDVIWCAPKDRPSEIALNPFLSCTLKVWDFCKKNLSARFVTDVVVSGPKMVSSCSGAWRAGGLYWLHNISSHGVLLAKHTLEDKYEVNIPWFEFLQVAHLFGNTTFSSALTRDLTMFASLLCDYSSTLRGFISKCYRALKAQAWNLPMTFQKAWNVDCNVSSNYKVWPLVWSSLLLKSKSLFIKLHFVKTIVRWYLTPRRISLFSKSVNPYLLEGMWPNWHITTLSLVLSSGK